jgi:sugar-specific transcriptional regulator TrmB
MIGLMMWFENSMIPKIEKVYIWFKYHFFKRQAIKLMSVLFIGDKETKLLTALGLTLLQARVYLTLVKFGKLSIKEISSNAKIARQDVYRITSELQEIGMIEKHISIPISFAAIQFESGINLLLELRREKNGEIEEAATEILKNFRKGVELPNLDSEVNPKFVLVPTGKILQQRVSQAMERTKTQMDFLSPERAFPVAYSNHIEVWQKFLEKGIKIRWIVSSITENLPKIPFKNPVGEFRFIFQPDIVPMGLYDEKEVIIATSGNLPLDPCLWSENPPLVSILQKYFDTLWRDGIKE